MNGRNSTPRAHATPWPWTLVMALAVLGTETSSTTKAPDAYGGAVQHPIEVRIQALDPVRHGGIVRLRLTATSRVAVRGLEARMLAAGGATALTANRARFGHVEVGGRNEAEFRVAIPEKGGRLLLQFRVEGEGASGRIARDATYNLLPQSLHASR